MEERIIKMSKEAIEYIENGTDEERRDSYKKDLMTYGMILSRHIIDRKKENLTEERVDNYAKIISMAFILNNRQE